MPGYGSSSYQRVSESSTYYVVLRKASQLDVEAVLGKAASRVGVSVSQQQGVTAHRGEVLHRLPAPPLPQPEPASQRSHHHTPQEHTEHFSKTQLTCWFGAMDAYRVVTILT